MIYKMEDVNPGDWITYKQGKSKSLHRGFSYQVQQDMSAQGIKGRGLTFEKTKPPLNYTGVHLESMAATLSNWLLNLLPEYEDQIRAFAPGNHAKELMVYINHGDKRVSMTPGKAFRRVFNNFHDMGIEALVDLYKNEFGPEELTIHRSFEPEAFSQVYRMTKSKKTSGFNTTAVHKALSNSCMQKKFSNLKYHPAFAYGSGEFEMVWAENQNGQLAARTILCPKNKLQFPIYATSKGALDSLRNIDTDCDLTLYPGNVKPIPLRKETSGLRRYNGDETYLMPYIDLGYAIRGFTWKLEWQYGDYVISGNLNGYTRG